MRERRGNRSSFDGSDDFFNGSLPVPGPGSLAKNLVPEGTDHHGSLALDDQPLDTVLGSVVVAHLTEPPTQTPPPSLVSLKLATGCPLLLDWPEEMQVGAPDPCELSSEGNWTAESTLEPVTEMARWSTSCGVFSGGLTPMTRFVLPNGEAFATSQARASLVGTAIYLRDCAGQIHYVLHEQVSHIAGPPDTEACERYGACDGVSIIQYKLTSINGTVLAWTTGLRLFQASLEVFDHHGEPLAEIRRVGEWTPVDGQCGMPRRWSVKFNAPDTAASVEPWAIAVLVTVMATRDASRRSSGLVMPTACEVCKAVLVMLGLFIAAGLVVAAVIAFMVKGLNPSRVLLLKLERAAFPRLGQLRSKRATSES